MNITPVINRLLETTSYNFNISLPIVVDIDEPLIFREYSEGDELVKSSLFNVLEPSDDKKQVFP